MRHTSPALYARALVEATHAKHANELEGDIRRFVAEVKRNGDSHTFPAIIRECEKAARAKAGKKLLTIEMARKLAPYSLESIKRSFAGEATDIEEKINPELVAGIRLTEDEERQLDASLTFMLNQIFR
jgi:F0F1-type ATP synthase delta subunit